MHHPQPHLATGPGGTAFNWAIKLSLFGLLAAAGAIPDLARAAPGTPLDVPELDSIASTLDTQATTWSTPLGVVLVIGSTLYALRSAGLAIVGILAGLGTVVLPPMIRNLGGTAAAAGVDGSAVATVVFSDAELFSQFAVNPLTWFTVLAFLSVRAILRTRRIGA